MVNVWMGCGWCVDGVCMVCGLVCGWNVAGVDGLWLMLCGWSVDGGLSV